MRTSTIQRLDGNGNPITGLQNTNWSVTHSHATAATATKAAVATKKHVVTGFIVSSDKAATVLLKEGLTTKMTFVIAAAESFAYSLPSFMECAVNTATSITIDGTAACSANLLGFTLDPA